MGPQLVPRNGARVAEQSLSPIENRTLILVKEAR
jgi:hypothetical protein